MNLFVNIIEKFAKNAIGLALNPLGWYTAYNTSVLEQQPHSTGEKALGAIFPHWFSAFKISKFAPEKTEKNTLWHFLGAAIFPMQYTAFQLAKLKNPQASDGEKALAIVTGPLYSIFASSTLRERQALGFTTGALARKPRLDQTSLSPQVQSPGLPQASAAISQMPMATQFNGYYSPTLMK